MSPVMSTEQGMHNTVEAEARVLGQCGRQSLIGLQKRKSVCCMESHDLGQKRGERHGSQLLLHS